MKQQFDIYPSLFLITPHRVFPIPGFWKYIEQPQKVIERGHLHAFHDTRFHLGKCHLNEEHNQLSIRFTKDGREYPHIPEALLKKLHPKTFRGKKYTLTYLPVWN